MNHQHPLGRAYEAHRLRLAEEQARLSVADRVAAEQRFLLGQMESAADRVSREQREKIAAMEPVAARLDREWREQLRNRQPQALVAYQEREALLARYSRVGPVLGDFISASY